VSAAWPPGEPPDASVRPWPCRHPGVAGSFDESARRASHDELAVARALAAEGHQVRTVAERNGARTPDLTACGTSVEVKGFQTLEQRRGRPPSPRSVANKLLDARGQGTLAVIRAGDSGLAKATAQAGYALFCEHAAERGLGRLRAVRVLGKDFDLSFAAVADVRQARQARQARQTGQGAQAAVSPGRAPRRPAGRGPVPPPRPLLGP
jgi:hypothetical protein